MGGLHSTDNIFKLDLNKKIETNKAAAVATSKTKQAALCILVYFFPGFIPHNCNYIAYIIQWSDFSLNIKYHHFYSVIHILTFHQQCVCLALLLLTLSVS